MIVVGHIERGKIFGELALEHNPDFPDKKSERAATITTTKRSTFATLTKKDFQNVLDRHLQKKRDILV
jgi:CRP-like cAMP-binding protein